MGANGEPSRRLSVLQKATPSPHPSLHPASYLLRRFPFLISRCSAHPKNIQPPALDIQDGVDSPSLLCYICVYDFRCYLSSIHEPNCSYSWPKASSSDKTVRPLFPPRIPPDPSRYEAYYDLYLGGQYTFKIIELHKEYGPIIRISPWELHISDPDFHDTLYASSASGHRRDKYDYFTKSFGLDKSVFATPQHDLHKMRRAALSTFFSMASARRLQPEI